jgi:hypothetical protein
MITVCTVTLQAFIARVANSVAADHWAVFVDQELPIEQVPVLMQRY